MMYAACDVVRFVIKNHGRPQSAKACCKYPTVSQGHETQEEVLVGIATAVIKYPFFNKICPSVSHPAGNSSEL